VTTASSSTHLYIAPAGTGKTTFVLKQARERARQWEGARVVVASSRQSIAAHRHLARLGGGMGVRIHTIFGLARELLDRAGSSFTLISDPIQVRFLRSLIDDARLDYYAPLARKPGFIRALRGLFDELTYAQISPSDFGSQVRRLGEPPRLAELARLYAMFQQRMAAERWMDNASLLLRAQETLEAGSSLSISWDLLGVDGFFRFRPAELALLKAVADRTTTAIITLTGDLPNAEAAAAATFDATIAQVERAFLVSAHPLPERTQPLQTPLHFVAAPDLSGEVRSALRWLKERIVLDGLQPEQVTLLARDLAPYRDAIARIAGEFGMPVQVSGGFSLRNNPAVDALVSLLNLLTPEPEEGEPDRRFPFRLTLAAWRSPYFDWRWPDDELAIEPQDADVLGELGRWARVTAGVDQWEDAFRRKIRQLKQNEEPGSEDEAAPAPLGLNEIQALQCKWEHFRNALAPPPGERPVHDFVRWLEDIIGEEPKEEAGQTRAASAGFSLNMVARIRSAEDSDLADRDIAALAALKDALRGMVWAAEALHPPPVSFPDFLADLAGMLEAARYEPRRRSGRKAIWALNVQEGAGLRFRAVALLGLAEGAFPAVLREDAFLRGADREAMQQAGLPINPSPLSEEAALFYLAASRADGPTLFTRPRLAQGGAEWQASPYWRTLVDALHRQPVEKRHETMLDDEIIASTSELMLALAVYEGHPQREMMTAAAGERWFRWEHGRHIIRTRASADSDIYDGYLAPLSALFARRFGPDHNWSAGRLEAYRHCPYLFFAASMLHLEERREPALGLDNQQMGRIFHRALELVFRRGAHQADDAEALIAIWEELADELLDAAPETYGFRPTAWWPQTRIYIKETIRITLVAQAAENEGWRPRAFEADFGQKGKPALIIPHAQRSDDALRVRGVIDRVDGDGRGGMRIVDYKRGGVGGYNDGALQEGKYLQLPLYALAASQALEHGRPTDGFYWSVIRAEPSKLRLSKFGVERAVELARTHAWDAVEGVRAGHFSPRPPKDGCPDFCPAAAFCWHYRPRR
jgi:ATP-dependent helicase/DNAse subunit B